MENQSSRMLNMFKKVIYILTCSVIAVAMFANDDYVGFCIDKYNPDDKKDEFIQCIEDLREASELLNSKKSSGQPKKPLDQRDFLSDEVFNSYSVAVQNEVLEAYQPYMDGSSYKALAQAVSKNLEIGNSFGYSLNESSSQNATKQAIKNCNYYKKRNEICVLHYVGEKYVLADTLASLRQTVTKNNNQIDWSRAADFFAKEFNTNPVWGNPASVKVCNFKNFSGEIIQGDCSTSSIRKGNDIYRKVQ